MLRRRFLKSLAAAPAAGLCHLPLAFPGEAKAQQRGGMAPADPFKPSEGVNHPIGAGKGIYPGRVTWVRDATATSWDGVTGHWWDDAYTNQKVVHGMTSRLLQDLTGRKDDKQAWDALFRSFNEAHNLGIPDIVRGRESRSRSTATRTGRRCGARGPGDRRTACRVLTPCCPW